MSMSSGWSGSRPPGWYDDGSGTVRWWDGAQWTQATHSESTPYDQTYSTPYEPSAYTPAYDGHTATPSPTSGQPQAQGHQPFGQWPAAADPRHHMSSDHGGAYGQLDQAVPYEQLSQIGSAGPYGHTAQQRKSRAPLVFGIVGAVVLAAAGGVLLWLLVFSGDDGPEAVADDWLYVQSCDDAEQYLTGQALEQNRNAQTDEDALCDFSDFSYSDAEISMVNESDDAATVEISMIQHYSGSEPDVPDDERGTVTLELVTEDGDWLISEILWCFDGYENEECQ